LWQLEGRKGFVAHTVTIINPIKKENPAAYKVQITMGGIIFHSMNMGYMEKYLYQYFKVGILLMSILIQHNEVSWHDSIIILYQITMGGIIFQYMNMGYIKKYIFSIPWLRN
jgi:hypothetical protein